MGCLVINNNRLKKLHSALIPFWLIFYCTDAWAQQSSHIDNPVLPGVADAGVIRYNGEYYLGGVFTKGSFYHSKDLVNWEGPVHVLSMDNEWTEGPSAGDGQIHANDINYINGKFHQYWSVNYWGKDRHVVHIGHAVASQITGPYEEPVKDHWLDNRIDPALFRDDDGSLFLYMVKFTDGNAIWARPMQDPWTFSGDPTYLFASLPNTWETMDNRVAEGPWVFKHRNQYYMMYNANHTSPRWGNYMLGVAQADGPLAFNHANKYSHPVVKSNQEDLEDLYVDLLKYSADDEENFQFTTSPPLKNWKDPDFDDAVWETGKMGFGSDKIKNSTSRQVKTDWKAEKIWLRKSFHLPKDDAGNLLLRIHHDGATRVFLNGQLVYEKDGADYTTWSLDETANAFLKDGKNILAIESAKGQRTGFLDVSLFDIGDQQGDDILYSPGQPNIVRGPNGFEWWLVYMANKNRERRGQYINRVHFHDKKLTVDGISSTHTPGLHPPPARPTFYDLFDTENEDWRNKWEMTTGDWQPENGELVHQSNKPSGALVQSLPASNYLFEANIKMSGNGTGTAGIFAWWEDENNWLKVELDPDEKSWAYTRMEAGESIKASFPLAENFAYQAYHNLRIFKNGDYFSVQLDDLPAPETPVIPIGRPLGNGRPGLVSERPGTAYDGIIYTMGWDEFDENIGGWVTADGDNADWSISETGISPTDPSGKNAVFKGDVLEGYEFSLQITGEGQEGNAGIYPVYLDEENYIKAVFDYEHLKFRISGKENGQAIEPRDLSVEGQQSHYTDIKYTDFIEKHFNFDSPVYLDGLRLSKKPHYNREIHIENMHQKVNIYFKQENKWYPLENARQCLSTHPGFDAITFDPIWAEGLKFVNKEAEDQNFYINKIWINQLFQKSYHVRVRRTSDKLVFWVNGKEMAQIPHQFAASKVGLITENGIANFNGISLYHLGE
ncbi:family 43 glycosylhydrolase [Negadavirga shengliensis]|uniref:Family 43 glycosylhydrolase n=1 Tax=Negadavirga shengliensis TaxID=1389218 RepID=A0ABV9T0G3_9BACT